MPYLTVGRENTGDIELYYEDHGPVNASPIVLVHGWPLSGRMWEKQVPALLAAGRRVITYDRRGFGESSRPAVGYDYDTLAADLHQLLTALDLRDVALAGFSMGGGEVARYIGTYGTGRVKRAAFLGAVPPYLRKAADNPQGVDASVFEGIQQALAADRPAFLSEFFPNFYNADALGPKRVSEPFVRLSWNIAMDASPIGTIACVSAWGTDFREDVAKIDVPTLVLHGDADRIVPLDATAKRMHEMIKGSRLVVVKDGPHGLAWTHADEVNRALLDWLR